MLLLLNAAETADFCYLLLLLNAAAAHALPYLGEVRVQRVCVL
jgi:hypothetical protein